MSKVEGIECTNYFRGIDGLGTCDTKCQWYIPDKCPCAKGQDSWDGLEHDLSKVKDGKA